MATLWWVAKSRRVSSARAGIGEYRAALRDMLVQEGFADVRSNDLEVAGGKNGCWRSIAHLQTVSDRDFGEMTMAAGDDGDVTRDLTQAVVGKIDGLRFL